MNPRPKIVHITTVDLALRFLLLAQLCRLRDEDFDVAAISAPGPWVADLEREGIRHIPWPHATRSWDLISDIRAFAELIRILRRERFDIVHTHNPKPGVMGRIAARLGRVPVVLNTVHGMYASPRDPLAKRTIVLGLERVAALLSDLELYQSEEDLVWARRAKVVTEARSVLLGNGVDLTHFDPDAVPEWRRQEIRSELGIPPDALVVGTVGRIVAEKGYREFFAAARRVKDATPKAAFVVVGERDVDKKDAISREEIESIQGLVTFAGWRQDVREVLAAVDVFVLASYREGVPRSAIEAAAMGKPLLLTDIRGCREVVRDRVDGLLVPPRDERALADAILELAGDAELRTKLGEAARAKAIERFDERRVIGTVVSASKQLLECRGLLF